MENRITDIHCTSCGAPAAFDIAEQAYLCSYCGGRVGIKEALAEKTGFRKMQARKVRESAKKYPLRAASCSVCGAEVVFEEKEALAKCAFCGSPLVLKTYLNDREFPECVIPFALTEEEAKEQLLAWCSANSRKPEAGSLKKLLPSLKGFYLPYELVRGPVHLMAKRMDSARSYPCESQFFDEFVSRSKQLDNLLLDGMEPYDLSALTGFDFGFVAGHRVRVSDISDEELAERVSKEAGNTCAPAVSKVLETSAVSISADVSSAVRLPVLLPVYYIAQGKTMAAVNGQTGKVSVRAEKESRYYFLPWWMKALLSTALFSGLFLGALRLGGIARNDALLMTGALALVLLIVTLALFSDTVRSRFTVSAGRKIYTSGDTPFRRGADGPVLRKEALARRAAEPVFVQNIGGRLTPVTLKFTTPRRVLGLLLQTVTVLFLPVITALFLNGFRFSELNPGGSAVWFCIMVPVVPVYLLKYGFAELHDNPQIYLRAQNGRAKRYRPKTGSAGKKARRRSILRALFVPPVSLAVWLGILCFFAICYFTAFGF